MRVIEVGALGRSSGASQVVIDISEGLCQRGHSVALVPSTPSSPEARSVVPDPIEIVDLAPCLYGVKAIVTPRARFPESKHFRLPDIVHFHGIYLPSHLRLARLSKKLGVPYIVSTHGNAMREAQAYHWFKKRIANALLVREFVESAAVVHVLGAEEAGDARSFFPRSRVRVIPNGIREDRLPPVRRRRDAASGFVFLYIGRLDAHHKGLDLLLMGVHRCATTLRRKGAMLQMVGPPESIRDEILIKSLIHDLGIGDLVSLLGPKYGDDKWETIARADVFVHTSRYEGMPLAVLEAMAAALPVVVTPGTNLASVVLDSDCGWVCKPSPESIAQAIEDVMTTDPDAMASKADRARSLVVKSYRLCDTIAQVEQLYKTIVNGAFDVKSSW